MGARWTTGVLVGALVLTGCWADGDDDAEQVGTGQEAPAPVAAPPTAAALLTALPPDGALAGGPWEHATAETQLADDHEDEGPLSICGRSGDVTANPLVHLLEDRSIEVGAVAGYQDEQETTRVVVVAAVVPDAAAHLQDARDGLPECAGGGIPETDWPEQGDEVAAFGTSGDTMIGPDGGMPGTATSTVIFVRVGADVVVGLVHTSIEVEWAELPSPPTEDELTELLGGTVERVEAVVAGETPPPPATDGDEPPTDGPATTAPGPAPTTLEEALPEADALPGDWERLVDPDPLDPDIGEPEAVCGSAPGSPIGDIVAQRVPDGASAIYTPADPTGEGAEVGVVLAPLADAADAVRAAGDDIDTCAAAGPDADGGEWARLDDPDLGDAAVAWELGGAVELAPGVSTDLRMNSWLVAVGDVVVSISVSGAPAIPGSPPGLDLAAADAEAFVELVVDRVAALG